MARHGGGCINGWRRSSEAAAARLRQRRFALTVLDLRGGGRSNEELASAMREFDQEMSVIALGAGRGVKVLGEQCLQVPFDSSDIVALAQHEVDVALRRRGRSAALREMESSPCCRRSSRRRTRSPRTGRLRPRWCTT
jgi:pimeloyl-ACP methyl ester carboxylesterase